MRVNKRALSEVFGISERTFTEYQKDHSFPVAYSGQRGQSNEYDTAEVFQWLQSRAVNGASRENAKERLDRIRGDREELAFAKDVGELVPAEEVEQELERVVMAIRSEVLTSNGRLKMEIDACYGIDLDVELLNEHSRTILTHLAAIGGQLEAGGREDVGEVHSATEDHDD